MSKLIQGAIFGAFFSIFVCVPTAFTQTAKVIKVQGKKAIVQFPDDARPHVGQTIDLGGGGISSMDGGSHRSSSTAARAMIIGGSAELSSYTVSGNASSTTSFAGDARYGWNAGVMEYGALGAFAYTSTTGLSSRALLAGGFFDYNLVPNTSGTELVYGGGAVARIGQISTTTLNQEYSGSVMQLDLGAQLKWFPLGNTVAIRGDILYRVESIGDSVKTKSTGSGLVAKAGLYVYF